METGTDLIKTNELARAVDNATRASREARVRVKPVMVKQVLEEHRQGVTLVAPAPEATRYAVPLKRPMPRMLRYDGATHGQMAFSSLKLSASLLAKSCAHCAKTTGAPDRSPSWKYGSSAHRE